MSTIKQIARLTGVSRGTVDRVLNRRGSVNPETASKVWEIAKAVNYSPNLAGKTLAVRKKQLKFGYILFGNKSGNPFFLDMAQGIETRAVQLEEYGVSVDIRHSAIDNPDQQARLMDELVRDGASGLAVTPINHPTVAERIRILSRRGIPVVTANSDLPHSGRIAYVGSDYYKSGETAAGLLALVCGGEARVGVVIGSPRVLCHSERVAGFSRRLAEAYPGMAIAGTAVNNDDDLESFVMVRRLLEEHPETDALFLAAAGVPGACRALKDAGRAGRVRVVSYDAGSATRELVREGVIAATIAQEPFIQGSRPLEILLDFLGMGVKPEKELNYTDIEIKIRENL